MKHNDKSMKKEFTPGMYCKFPNEEIPHILDILRANGHKVMESHTFEKYDDAIIMNDNGDLHGISVRDYQFNECTELSRHDFMVLALRLEEGMGLRDQDSTTEQRLHIYEELKSLGINNYPKCTFDDEWKNLAYVKKYDGSGHHVTAVIWNFIKDPIPYLDWCKRLCVEPIGIELATEPVFDPSKPFEVSHDGVNWMSVMNGSEYDGVYHSIRYGGAVSSVKHIRNIQEFNASMLEVGEFMETDEGKDGKRNLIKRISDSEWFDVRYGVNTFGRLFAEEITKGRRVNVEIKVLETKTTKP